MPFILRYKTYLKNLPMPTFVPGPPPVTVQDLRVFVRMSGPSARCTYAEKCADNRAEYID